MIAILIRAVILLLFFIFPTSAYPNNPHSLKGVFAKSFIVVNSNGVIVLEKDSKTPRPIASITKLLVAEQLQFILDKNFPDIRPLGKHSLTDQEMLQLAIIASSNISIIELSKKYGNDSIVNGVNTLARQRGLHSIYIDEPSGLSKNNVASAEDLAAYVQIIKDSSFAKVSTSGMVKVSNKQFNSTNPFIGKEGWNFTVSKTGFINAAGGCLVTIVDIGGNPYTIVLLGSSNTASRWYDLMRIRFHLSNESFWGMSQVKNSR